MTNGMTGNQKVFTIIALAICAGVYFHAEKYLEMQSQAQQESIHTQKLTTILSTIKEVANQATNTQFQQAIQAIESHTQKGFAEIARSVSDADKVTLTQTDNTTLELNKPQLEKIVEELDKQEKAKTGAETLDLYIDGVKRQEGKITIFARTLQNEAFTANIDADMLGEEGVNEIIDRVKDIRAIKLNGMVKRRAGKIEQAIFTTIQTEE